jgi:hypothetical protein
VTTPSGATCTTEALANGTYSCTLSPDPVDGEDITVSAVDLAGNESPNNTVTGGISTEVPSAPVFTHISDDTGTDSTDEITSDNTLEVHGMAPPNTDVLIYVDGILIEEVRADENGNFIWNALFPDGTYTLTAISRTDSGTLSEESDEFPVTVDTSAIVDITGIPDLTDASDTGASNTDNVTGVRTPTFTVECDEEGSAVTLYANGQVVGTHICTGQGQEEVTASTLPFGTHQITYSLTDRAGNESLRSQTLEITISEQGGEGTIPVYRFWSETYRSHFYTKSQTERDFVIINYPDNIWLYEGVAFHAYAQGSANTTPVYRLWSETKRTHFYTISETERDAVAASPDWEYEGIEWYAHPAGQSNSVPLYRFYSPTYDSHFYTKSSLERDITIGRNGNWQLEGIAYYIPQ